MHIRLLCRFSLSLLLITLISFPVRAQSVKGRIERIKSIESRYAAQRITEVWLPEGYDPARNKYCVVYMHDGQNLFDSTFSYGGKEWKVDETLTDLRKNGLIKDCIVVAIWNTPLRFLEYAPQKPFGLMNGTSVREIRNEANYGGSPLSDDYLKFIVLELKPYIDKHYATLTGPEGTFISGSSMGGLISLYALTEYPEVFGGAACISTHWPLRLQNNSQAFTNASIEYLSARLDNLSNKKFYFDYGTETLDAWYEVHQVRIDSLFRAKGFTESNFLSIKFPGHAHNEASWAERFHIPAAFLLKP